MVQVERQASLIGRERSGATPSVKEHGVLILLKSPDSSNDVASEQLLKTFDQSKLTQVLLTEDHEILSFVVMSKHGSNLEDLMNSGKFKLKDHQIFTLGLHLLDIIEQIHASGYVFNDLKLDNILLA